MVELNTLGFDELSQVHTRLRNLAAEAAKKATFLKQKRDEVENVIIHKLQDENMTSARTSCGQYTVYTHSTVKLDEKESFLQWLKKGLLRSFLNYIKEGNLNVETAGAFIDAYLGCVPNDNFYLLSGNCILKKEVMALATDDDLLPPGVGWFKELKLSITKNKEM